MVIQAAAWKILCRQDMFNLYIKRTPLCMVMVMFPNCCNSFTCEHPQTGFSCTFPIFPLFIVQFAFIIME